MTLTTGPILARTPERRFAELLNEWLGSYFTGGTFAFPTGDATFPVAERYFNQVSIPVAKDAIQIHTVFTDWRPHEQWYASGPLQTWQNPILARLASGVSYGSTTDGRVEESVHGASTRLLPGSAIRWQPIGPDLHEQVFDGTTWSDTRIFPNRTALRWIRSGLNYVEQSTDGTSWFTERTVTPIDSVWDGTKTLVTVEALLSIYVRQAFKGGDANATEFAVRDAAALLDLILRDKQARSALTAKGTRRITVEHGPAPLVSSGYATRLLIVSASLKYFVPQEGI